MNKHTLLRLSIKEL